MTTTTLNATALKSEISNLFTTFHPQSRVWVYQSSRILNDSEVESITATLKSFCKNWTAHQVALRADAVVLFKTFIILIVDEAVNGASGCSIDKSVKLIQDLEQQYHIELMNRMLIAVQTANGIEQIRLSDLKRNIENYKEDYFFNNSISTLSELHNNWLIPISGSFLTRT